MSHLPVKNALISVYDKTGILEFAKGLVELNVRIISTGGTFKLLKENGLPVIPVDEVTGFPEMMHGRVKTLHPKIHGGILADRDVPEHMQALKTHQIDTIDLVCVNLYPFVKVTSDPNCSLADAIENIDIGGPTMLRAASKNWRFVSVVTDPQDYPKILEEMKATGGKISEATNFELAKKTFQLTARYDGAISRYLGQFSGETAAQML